MVGDGLLQPTEALRRLDNPIVRLGTGPIAPAPGQQAEGTRGVNSIA
jgi:hypothetical protein